MFLQIICEANYLLTFQKLLTAEIFDFGRGKGRNTSSPTISKSHALHSKRGLFEKSPLHPKNFELPKSPISAKEKAKFPVLSQNLQKPRPAQ